jgi:competence protein ComEC
MVEPVVRDPGATQIDESFAELSGRIEAPVQQSADRFLMIVRLDEVTPESSSPTRVKLPWRGPERQVFHGDRIGFRAHLRTPTGSLNPGG